MRFPVSGNRYITRTNCQLCGYLCGLLATVEDGRIIKIKPDASRYPYDETLVRSCLRNRSLLEFLDHPSRINYPLKRFGERGSGQWQRIGWDQAIDEIAKKLQELKDKFGAETLATSIGGPHTVFWPMHRFLNLFGSPNNMGIGQICWNPAVWINTLTFGWPVDFELEPGVTQCAIIWGINPAESDNSLFWRTVRNFKHQGGNLIVIDPRYTKAAGIADLWLPIKPGTDDALAAGLIKIILDEHLYDPDFVNTWCFGLEHLQQKMASFSIHDIGEITGLGEARIYQAARLFTAQNPATIISGRGIDQLGYSSIQTHRGIAVLRAVTGNVDVPGASHIACMPDFIPEIDFELTDRLPSSQAQKQLGAERILLQNYQGYDLVQEQTVRFNQRLPQRYLTSAHPHLIWQAMTTGMPYPIRAMIVMGSNPLSSQADTHLIYEALKSLDLLVVLELVNTPTTMLADYVLPIAGVLERPVLQTNAGIANIAYGGNAAISPMYERHYDFDFWRGLGVRLGQKDDWPWETFHKSLDATFAPLGMNWEAFCETGLYNRPNVYRKFTQPDPKTGQERGFSTPSGRIELYSNVLESVGYDPLPGYTPPKTKISRHSPYPLTLISGARKQPFYASGFHQIESLRKTHPTPWAEMSAVTAMKLTLAEGDPVLVETIHGKARFTVHLTGMRDDVVSVEYGWWYPELSAEEPVLSGLWISNANLLTSAAIDDCDPLLGQWAFNGLPCRVIPVKENENNGLGTLPDQVDIPQSKNIENQEIRIHE
ncbi:MAG: molybdopterin-dependent oxidoreductase [Anaerolineales bacterium]|nr:molybdopterin-dependent oxidoreductase [Anaerolineales bacterium]